MQPIALPRQRRHHVDDGTDGGERRRQVAHELHQRLHTGAQRERYQEQESHAAEREWIVRRDTVQLLAQDSRRQQRERDTDDQAADDRA